MDAWLVLALAVEYSTNTWSRLDLTDNGKKRKQSYFESVTIHLQSKLLLTGTDRQDEARDCKRSLRIPTPDHPNDTDNRR